MTLTLTILASPGAVSPHSRQVPDGSFSLGRSPQNDWVLPDPDRHLSKRHCVITVREGCWEATDLSTNGTFLNDEDAPIGQGNIRALRDGDRLRLGGYEVAAHVAEVDRPILNAPSALDSLGNAALLLTPSRS